MDDRQETSGGWPVKVPEGLSELCPDCDAAFEAPGYP